MHNEQLSCSSSSHTGEMQTATVIDQINNPVLYRSRTHTGVMQAATAIDQMNPVLYRSRTHTGEMQTATVIDQINPVLDCSRTHTGEMQAATDIDCMNPVLYKAVVKGNVEDYHEALRQMPEEAPRRQVTPKGNTVLHVAAIHGHEDLVEEILKDDDAGMSLLFAKNNRNQSVLHCAAEKGYHGVVSAIFSAIKNHGDVESAGGRVREMIEMKDDVDDTALHKAVRMGYLEVVKLLIQEYPEFKYETNQAGETPIYIAAESQFSDCLKEMLSKFTQPTYGGPLGRNALHGAILSGISDGALSEKERSQQSYDSSHINTTGSVTTKHSSSM